MSRKRLPLPNEVVEHCKLCAAELEISVNNPRRVCAQCGEVNLPSDEVPDPTARQSSPRGVLSASSRTKWLAHGVALSVQLAVVLLVAWRLGAGGKFDLGLLFVGVAFVSFCGYALVVSVPVVFLRTTRQVLLFDCVAPLVTLLAIGLSVFGPRGGSTPARPVPAATPERARGPKPPLPPAPPLPKPRAPAAPGWEQSAMLASFSVAEEGAAFRIRFVPHFTGRLEVRAGHPQLIDLSYGSTTCEAKAEEPTECVLVLSRPQRPSAVRYELSAAPHDGSRQRFGGQVTAVRVDASGAGRPR